LPVPKMAESANLSTQKSLPDPLRDQVPLQKSNRAGRHRLALPFDTDEPTDSELRIAHAQLVGWLEGLFHGIQAALFAQQLTAQSQLEEMRRRSLPAAASDTSGRPGPYL